MSLCLNVANTGKPQRSAFVRGSSFFRSLGNFVIQRKIAQVECLATKGRFDDADAKGLLDKAIWYAKNTGCGIIELTLPYHIVAVDNFLSRADFNPPVGLTGYSMAL